MAANARISSYLATCSDCRGCNVMKCANNLIHLLEIAKSKSEGIFLGSSESDVGLSRDKVSGDVAGTDEGIAGADEDATARNVTLVGADTISRKVVLKHFFMDPGPGISVSERWISLLQS